MAARSFDRPRGTRDLYPEDYLQRRYITETWRRVALRHGFDEIDGPTFEHLDLYTVKSGEGIVSELFSFSRAGGDETYALRPEYTPTLARQYAARAGQLPKPTRWFSIGPYFRAERPQRGRLREFLQWNVDVLGDETPLADAELVSLMDSAQRDFGLKPHEVTIIANHRGGLDNLIGSFGIPESNLVKAYAILDRLEKDGVKVTASELLKLVPKPKEQDYSGSGFVVNIKREYIDPHDVISSFLSAENTYLGTAPADGLYEYYGFPAYSYYDCMDGIPEFLTELHEYREHCKTMRCDRTLEFSYSIVRGLAYYTGLVFEMRAEGERAVAGGGRYDKLIELLGGPPTPAVGFAMGDVVLANLLADKGLMPTGKDLLAALSQPIPTRPDAFVIAGPDAQEDAILRTCATLRRGVEHDTQREPWHPDRYQVPPLHTRRSYKATRNVGKLLKDAASASARFAVIVETDAEATVKDLDSGEQWSDKVALDDLAARLSAAL